MTRTARHDADYFPFYVKDGKTLFILQEKYGLRGIGFFTNLMRFLCKQPDHHICIESETDRLYFFAQIHADEKEGLEILSVMAKTGKIDESLWTSRMVIVSPDLLGSLIPLYQKRTNPIIDIDQIRLNFPGKDITAPDMPTKGTSNPQRRGEESKYVVICLCFRCILYYNYYSLQFFIPINTTTIITIMIMIMIMIMITL